MKLWFVSMECAGIAEAGGVKNVTYSLCREFARLNHKVTLFLPVFKCNLWDYVCDLQDAGESEVKLCGKTEKIVYKTATYKDANFDIVLVNHPSFAEKEAVYTYTENEQKCNAECVKGSGHKDALFMDVLFQRAVEAYGKLVQKSNLPEIIHCQDASTATLPGFLNQNKLYKKTKSVVTIHNAGPAYHHEFSSLGEAVWYTSLSENVLREALNGSRVEPFLIAAASGAVLTTVSDQYAQELVNPYNSSVTDGLAPVFFAKKIDITGITNGFDFERYNPVDKNCSTLPFEFNPEKCELDGKFKCRKFFIQNIVNTDNYNCRGIKKHGKLECSSDYTREIYFAYHGRIATQKGISVLMEAIPAIIQNFPDVRFIIAGQGETRLEMELISLAEKFPGKVTYLNGYNKVVARLAVAVSDFIVLPSYFEPCGLEDFIAQCYGTVPVAHKTGGLNKIQDRKTGFLYENNTKDSLITKISEVIMTKQLKPLVINKMIKAGSYSVQHEYHWKNVVQKKYLPFFKEILKNSKI